ncbi:glycosyltransferase, partial [Paracoccus sp. MC1854]|uniref:glycosyltransferase n=1 Tax=Paracoccus sp. MC1854 TaxID=2760306 RepID=UPI0015FF9C9A
MSGGKFLCDTGIVIIGRNEGTRLKRCLASVSGQAGAVVYVDSGSTDGSPDAARQAGVDVVDLDMSQPFTAARARNAGFARLMVLRPGTRVVQFVDGDCELHPGWLGTAYRFLQQHPDVAVVSGRLRERFPEASVYNRLADAEWQAPLGEARACGGNAMMRAQPFQDQGGFNPALIAGEEPELCVRLRKAGWRIWRLDAEMGLHDAAMTRFGQWWRRAKRSGHAAAEGAAMHGSAPERHKLAETRRALIWGLGLPLLVFVGWLVTPWAALLLLAWPLQVLRLRLRGEPWERALFLTLAKFPEAQGVLRYAWQ